MRDSKAADVEESERAVQSVSQSTLFNSEIGREGRGEQLEIGFIPRFFPSGSMDLLFHLLSYSLNYYV